MRNRTYVLDFFLIALLAVVLVWPLFRLKYQNNWSSIESTFLADARFLSENWPHPRWQPLWYCGTRFDYIYPPALRYGTAVLTKIFPIVPARAYHLYTALFYCLGIAGVYLLARAGSGSRVSGWLAAAATALVSPSFLFVIDYRREAIASKMMPQRLSVLVRYGEGPHVTAVAVLGIALAAAWVALRGRRPAVLALAVPLCALVVSNNFYGATALAIFFPLLVWSQWITWRDNRVWLRAAAVAALAYACTAFWLTPSYLKVTTENLRLVSQEGNRWSTWVALAAAALFGALTWRFARGRKDRAWTVFVIGAAVFFSLNVLGHYFLGFRVAGEPLRLVPELDLALILLAAEGVRCAWSTRRLWVRAPVAILVAACFLPATRYVPHAWRPFVPDLGFRDRIEYRITDWLSRNMPDARGLATGSVRFWYDAWHDLPQVGGGSEQGLMNLTPYEAQWQLTAGNDVAQDVLWMQAVGADAIIVHDQRSQEIYHDFTYPQRFQGKLEAVFDSGEGDVIYRIPRRFPDRARVVETARLRAVPEKALAGYANVVEHGPDSRARLMRESTDAMLVHAMLRPGESLVVQETYDPYWRAYSDGRRLAVRKDAFGFMEVEAPPGERDVRLVFELPLENAIGRVISAAAAACVLGMILAAAVRGRKAFRVRPE